MLGIVAKFILPPLQKVMAEREATIRGTLTASDEGRSEAERLSTETSTGAGQCAGHRARTALLEEASHQAEEARAAERARGQIEHDRLLTEAEANTLPTRSAGGAERSRRRSWRQLWSQPRERLVGVRGRRAKRHRAVARSGRRIAAARHAGELRQQS